MQAIVTNAAAADLSTWSLIVGASPTVKAVMALLAVMSIISWYIIGYKYLLVRRAAGETERFNESFWRSKEIEQIYKHAQALKQSPVSAMFLAGYAELAKLGQDPSRQRDRDADLAQIQRARRRAQTTEVTKLETAIPFLATTGSAAPFIGLFGTVWGILISFRAIGAMQTATLQQIA